MIRRDYILRMIEEFTRALAKIMALQKEMRWAEAEATLEERIDLLTGTNLANICTLTDTELFARLLQTGDFHAQAEKAFMLARLLTEAAEVKDAGNESAEFMVRTLRLKALHLLLNSALRSDVNDWPGFVPGIDLLLQRLANADLPIHTHALLMQHFERSHQFAKAEDAFGSMLDLAPDNPQLRELGVSFYHRLLQQPDAALEEGNLPRNEVEEGLKVLLE